MRRYVKVLGLLLLANILFVLDVLIWSAGDSTGVLAYLAHTLIDYSGKYLMDAAAIAGHPCLLGAIAAFSYAAWMAAQGPKRDRTKSEPN